MASPATDNSPARTVADAICPTASRNRPCVIPRRVQPANCHLRSPTPYPGDRDDPRQGLLLGAAARPGQAKVSRLLPDVVFAHADPVTQIRRRDRPSTARIGGPRRPQPELAAPRPVTAPASIDRTWTQQSFWWHHGWQQPGRAGLGTSSTRAPAAWWSPSSPRRSPSGTAWPEPCPWPAAAFRRLWIRALDERW